MDYQVRQKLQSYVSQEVRVAQTLIDLLKDPTRDNMTAATYALQNLNSNLDEIKEDYVLLVPLVRVELAVDFWQSENDYLLSVLHLFVGMAHTNDVVIDRKSRQELVLAAKIYTYSSVLHSYVLQQH